MQPIIKVIGVGGSGSNTVSRMAKFQIQEVELLAVNTDAQALYFSKSRQKDFNRKRYYQGPWDRHGRRFGKKGSRRI